MRDVASQIEQEDNAISPQQAARGRNLSPPKVECTPGKARRSPSPSYGHGNSTLLASPHLPLESPTKGRPVYRGSETKPNPRRRYGAEPGYESTRKGDNIHLERTPQSRRSRFDDAQPLSKATSVYTRTNPGELPPESNNHAVGTINPLPDLNSRLVLAAPNNSKETREQSPVEQAINLNLQEYETIGGEDPY